MGHTPGMRIPSTPRRPLVFRPDFALCALALMALLAGCTRHTTARSTTIHHDLLTGNVVSAPRGDLKQAVFELASGVTTVVVHSAALNDALYRITTPDGSGIVPAAVLSDGHVAMQTTSSGTNGPSIVDIALNSQVSWSIHLDGGATETTVDMRDGGLAALDFGAGVTRIDVTLPLLSGTELVPATQQIRMAGGASEFTVHAPQGIPTRVTMGGGGSSATLDGVTHTGIAGGTVFAPEGWDTAKERVDINNTAGVSTFTLDRY